MALIVIEGVDNSGKSTLADRMKDFFLPNCIIQRSEGPDRGNGEINERIKRYNVVISENERKGAVIFDRHPCVSEPIYSQYRSDGKNSVNPALIEAFYERRPLFIYCADRGLRGHIEKAHDKPEHLSSIKDNHSAIVGDYMHWALARAHIIYRVGDDMERVCLMAQRGA